MDDDDDDDDTDNLHTIKLLTAFEPRSSGVELHK